MHISRAIVLAALLAMVAGCLTSTPFPKYNLHNTADPAVCPRYQGTWGNAEGKVMMRFSCTESGKLMSEFFPPSKENWSKEGYLDGGYLFILFEGDYGLKSEQALSTCSAVGDKLACNYTKDRWEHESGRVEHSEWSYVLTRLSR